MIRERAIRAAGAFHREERAQISFLAIAGFVCFVALLAMVMNTSDMVTDRVHMQDVADVTALSAASWEARGLNIVSFINVLNSKLIATAVLLNALADALPVIIAVGEVQYAIFQGCTGVPFVGAFCAAMAIVVRAQLAVLRPLQKAVNKAANQLSRCNGSATLWKMMGALEKVAGGVQKSFVGIGLVEAIDIAKANGATVGFAMNGELLDKGITLPLKQEAFTAYCPKVMNGGPGFEMQNYACKQGPLKLGRERINKTLLLPFTNLVAQPIFMGMVMSHNLQIGCKNAPGDSNKITVQLKDHAECKRYDAEARWSHVWSKTRVLDDGNLKLEDFVPWYPTKEHKDGGDKDEDDAPDVQDQLDNINITPEDEDSDDAKSKKPPGRALQYIQTETAINSLEVDCRGDEYPMYSKPIAGWDGDVPGTVGWCPPNFTECKRIDKFSEFTFYSGEHQKNGAKTVGGYFIRVARQEIEPQEENGPTRYAYIVETVSMVSAGETKMSPEQFKKYLEQNGQKNVNTKGSQSSKGCTKPQPWVLEKPKSNSAKDREKYANKFRFIALVYKDLDDDPPFWSTFFDSPPRRVIAYSQAQVYNYLSEDTFTQDWRVRLEQASLLEDFVKKVPVPDFAISKSLGAVNNH